MKRLLFLFLSVCALSWAQITSIPSGPSTATQIIALFTGCSGTLYLGADGACHAAGAGTINTANAGDVAVYSGANAVSGIASDNLFFDTTNQRLGVNFGTTPPVEFSVKYKSANTSYAVPVLVLDNPSAGATAAETISFKSNGIERARISSNQNGGLTISSDVQGTGSKPLVISTFDVGGATNNNITISTNVGSSGLNSLGAGSIALNASQGSAYIYFAAGANHSFNANGAANVSTDIVTIDAWAPGSGHANLRLRNGPPSGSDTTANPFSIVNTTVNGPTNLAFIGPLAQPASVGTSPGTNEATVFSLTGAGGGNTTIATTGVGGNAGAWNTVLGNGGTANSVSGANSDTGGNGGAWNLTTGNGANATATDTGTNTGGNGGIATITLGTGGTASGGSTNTAGKDGYLRLTPASAFASLPTCAAGIEGAIKEINNSNTVTFNATAAGGGSSHVMVFCNGTNWVVF